MHYTFATHTMLVDLTAFIITHFEHKFHVTCTVHAYEIIIYKLMQHYAYTTVQKYSNSQATLRHVSVAATTTFIREDNTTDQSISTFELLYVHNVGSICS
jgi:hypothetical protein